MRDSRSTTPFPSPAMDHHTISQQILIEHQTLAYVASALRTTLAWHYEAVDLSRKLASLSFVGQSFERHLKRLMALEEADGYMAVVCENRPELSERVDALRQEHVKFRRGVSRMMSRLRKVEPTDHATFDTITAEVLTLLDQLDEHHRKETELLQEALLRDEGGEG